MDALEILDKLKYVGGGIVVFLLGFIKIPKVELNIWNWLGKIIGRSLTRDLFEEIKDIKTNIQGITEDVDNLDKKLSDHIYYDELSTVASIRQRILRFNDEILESKSHTEESFNCILEDIDCYEKYSSSHPDYPNNKAVMAISNIKEVYRECLKNKLFRR